MSDERIDLTQFEKITHEIHSFNVIINGEETTEYQRSDLWNTWILNEQRAAEGKALAVFTMDMQNPVCLIEGYETAEEGLANAKAIAHVPKIIAELKECYEEIDWMKSLVKNLYRLLHDADEDMAYNWAIKYVGEEDMWIVRDNASE